MSPLDRIAWLASLSGTASATALRVATAIAWRVNKDSGSTWASIDCLGDDCGLKRRSVLYAVAELESIGAIDVRRKQGTTNTIAPRGVQSFARGGADFCTGGVQSSAPKQGTITRNNNMGEESVPIGPMDLGIYGAIVTHANQAQWAKLMALHGTDMVVKALEHLADNGQKAWLADVGSLLLKVKRQRNREDENIIYE